MKKVFTFMITALLIFALAGCGLVKEVIPLQDIKNYTAEDFEIYMGGLSREKIINAWGEPHDSLSKENADVWMINDEKLVTVYWDENDKLQTASVSTVIPSYYIKPQDTQLEFWITEDVASVDFSAYSINPGWMGATEYYGKGYVDGDTEYVSYLVSAYPDYADGGSFVTRITVTDPEIEILGGLTASSSMDDWYVALRTLGFEMCENTDKLDEETEYKKEWSSSDNKVNVTLTKRGNEYLWCISVVVTNRDNIIY